MSQGWISTRVDRVATVRARIGWKALTASEYQPSGYVLLSTPNIKNAEIDFENVNYVDEFRYNESPEIKLCVGDVLLAKDGNTLGITNLVRSLPRPATVNGSIAVIRPFGVGSRYLRYVLASAPLQSRMAAVKDGMGVPHLFQWDINRLQFLLPPLDEQGKIADFLDAETARVDELIALRALQGDLMEEALRASSSELAGGRLRLAGGGNRLDASKLGRVLTGVQTGTTPVELLLPGAGGGALPWYTPAALDGTLAIAAAEKSVEWSSRSLVPRFPAGSIVIVGIGESLGKIGILDHEATGNQQLTALALDRDVDLRFMAWQLYSGRNKIRSWAQYSRIRILNNETLRGYPVHLPAIREQVSRRRELDRRLVQLQEFRSRAQRFEKLAHERRQALITAAVTGQIDVTTARGVDV